MLRLSVSCFRKIFLSVLFSTISLAITNTAYAKNFDYGTYSNILKKYVHRDKTIHGITLNVVDYDGIHKESLDPASDYSRLLKQLSAFDPASLPSRDTKIAFWINAYNIGAIKMMIDNYPAESIRSFKIHFLKNPWGIKILNINGVLYSLSTIESELLLGLYKEPKAHFAITCASLSCPDIREEPYTGNALYTQLSEQAERFFKNPKKGLYIDKAQKKVYVSRIFKYDSKTFSRGKQDIIPFITSFIKDKDTKNFLKTSRYELLFLDYDWSVNGLSKAE